MSNKDRASKWLEIVNEDLSVAEDLLNDLLKDVAFIQR